MSIKETVGSNVRGFRKLNRLNQTQFALKAALNRSYLAALERGEVNITIENLERIATIIGVPPHVLLVENSYKWMDIKSNK